MEFRDLPLLTEPRNTCQGHELQEKKFNKTHRQHTITFRKSKYFSFSQRACCSVFCNSFTIEVNNIVDNLGRGQMNLQRWSATFNLV